MMSFIQRPFNVHRGISFIHRRHDRKNNSSEAERRSSMATVSMYEAYSDMVRC
ncbi:hypothetical protein H8K38_01860 [Undibacterium sp. FT79W]|uniref:hypothetical protein n=1 Tax=Undibacterium sp. FT79W TaxID=2762296 RepID=UPI00164AAC5B|nr:hypothetical protein [Undibacterium sp. FT79W]MBC3876544.1 hypothetical protein [Undibacterium sp. FT79W]